ncbi:MAG: YtxH domain-containing protein [Propionibacteriales bacterium]|nr:YtxH domain-containing protein [Propionibacteriales bacterium]
MGKLSMLAGGAVGYVLGARAGQGRYEQIKSQAQRVLNDPRVQRKATEAADLAKEKAAGVADSVTDRSSGSQGGPVGTAKVVVGTEPTNNEGPENRQPAPPMGI